MTREEAIQNLSLPEDADGEMIRRQFAAKYSLSDARYDRTLTEGMKEIHEQHMRELEQAYKVLSGQEVIADMGALLSQGKGFVSATKNIEGNKDGEVDINEALAFFSVYDHSSPLLAEQRHLQYLRELEGAMAETGLESAKEPFRQEIEKSEYYLTIALNYLVSSRFTPHSEKNIPPHTPSEKSTEVKYEQDFNLSPETPTARKAFKYKWIIGVLSLLLLISIALLIKEYGHPAEVPEEDMVIAESSDLVKPEPKDLVVKPVRKVQEAEASAPVEVNEPDAVGTKEIEDILKKYTSPDFEISVSKASIIVNRYKYVFPLRQIREINKKGQLVSVSPEGFVVKETKDSVSGDFIINTADSRIKKQLMDAIRAIAPLPKSPAQRKRLSDSTAVSKDSILGEAEKKL